MTVITSHQVINQSQVSLIMVLGHSFWKNFASLDDKTHSEAQLKVVLEGIGL